jgi:hypothetical protein
LTCPLRKVHLRSEKPGLPKPREGKPCHAENEQVESFNGKLRDELLKRESFDTVLEAKVLVQRWRRD